MSIVINSLTPVAPVISSGGFVTFQVDAVETGGATLSYEWQYSIDGNTYTSNGLVDNVNSIYNTSTLTSSQTGIYFRVAVSDGVSIVYSNLYPGIGDRQVTVVEDPTIITQVNDLIDYYPSSQVIQVGDNFSFTASATLGNADISNTTLVSSINFQWQYSADGGDNWINLNSGGDITIVDTIDTIPETNDSSYYKYSTITYSNATFDINLYQYRAIVTFSGATNSPLIMPPILVLVSPEITIYRQPGEGDDTVREQCYKTEIPNSGQIKLQVAALTTANTALTFRWQVSLNDNVWFDINTLLINYNAILKPGTTANTDILELERVIYYDRYSFRCVVSGVSGEADVISDVHYVYMEDIQVNPIINNGSAVIDIIEDRYGDIANREQFTQDPVKNFTIVSLLDIFQNTGINGSLSLQYQRQISGSTSWENVGEQIIFPRATDFYTYTQFPTDNPEFIEPSYTSRPVRRLTDDQTKYRLEVEASSIYNLSGDTKTLLPYYSSEVTLNVYRTVYLTNQPADSRVFPNQSTSFSVTALPSSGDASLITYQWQYSTSRTSGAWVNITDNSKYVGSTTDILTVNDLQSNETYRYFRCVVSIEGQLTSVTSDVAEVTTTRDFFTFISSLNDVYTRQNENVSFEVQATTLSVAQITYQWQKSTDYNSVGESGTWTDIPGKTTNSLSFISVSPSDNAFYRLKLTSFGGEIIYTNAARLEVLSLEITITQNIPTSIEVLEGVSNSYTFSCRGITNFEAPVEYQWQQSVPFTPITGQTFEITSGQSYTVDGTSYPVYGWVYVPDVVSNSVDVVVCYHGTITSQTTSIMSAAETFLNFAISNSSFNLRDKIVFSVAYPQDSIPAANQFGIGGNEDPNFIFGSNIPYARASLLWAQNSLNTFISTRGLSKTVDRVFTFGHSQGGYLAHILNTLETVDGVIMNAPGPIKLDLTCQANQSRNIPSTTCDKLFDLYGSAFTSPTEYQNLSLIRYDNNLRAPMLFIQPQQDTAGGGNQPAWMEDLLDAISANNLSNADFTYLPIPGDHDAFINSTQAFIAVRNFVNSNAGGAQFANLGFGFNNSSDTSPDYFPLAFDRLTDDNTRIRCELTSEDIPVAFYTNECTLRVNRVFSYFADSPIKNVSDGSPFILNLASTWTGGTPEYLWESSTDGSNWSSLGETTDSYLIPIVDSSLTGRFYRCRITLEACNFHEYYRNNVRFFVPASTVTYTVPVRLNVVAAAQRPKYYSLESQKTGAAIGTVICVPKPPDFQPSLSTNADDIALWNVAISGGATENASSSVVTSGNSYNANKPAWTNSSYTSPRWVQSNDRFQGYLEMRGQFLRAREFPELARTFGTTYGGSITGTYPSYNTNDTFRMPLLYGKRLMGTGNVDNNRGSVSINPLFNPDGVSGGDKNVPGSMGGRYNYETYSQLPPGSPGVGRDGEAGIDPNPATFALGSFSTTGVGEVNAFVQPNYSGTVFYSITNAAAATVTTPIHNHRAVVAAWEERQASSPCFGFPALIPQDLFIETRAAGGEVLPFPETGNRAHGHTAQGGVGSFDMVREGGMSIGDTTLRLSGQSQQLFNNSLRFFLRNAESIPVNSPYFRLKYLIKAY